MAAAGSRRGSRLLNFRRQLVHAVAELRRGEANHILAVQLLRDLRERWRELARLRELEVAAAGFVGHLAQTAVRFRTDLHLAVEVAALEADRIDHHLVPASPPHHPPPLP